MMHATTQKPLPVERSICKTLGTPIVQSDVTKTMHTRTPTFGTSHLKLAKTFPDNASEAIVDPYLLVVTQGQFVNITGKNLDQDMLQLATTTLCWGNAPVIM